MFYCKNCFENTFLCNYILSRNFLKILHSSAIFLQSDFGQIFRLSVSDVFTHTWLRAGIPRPVVVQTSHMGECLAATEAPSLLPTLAISKKHI